MCGSLPLATRTCLQKLRQELSVKISIIDLEYSTLKFHHLGSDRRIFCLCLILSSIISMKNTAIAQTNSHLDSSRQLQRHGGLEMYDNFVILPKRSVCCSRCIRTGKKL